MNVSLHITLASTIALMWGCGPSEEAREQNPSLPPESAAPSSTAKRLQLESRTDTVTTTAEIQNAAPESLAADSRGAFTVQIGAFKEPKNAARAQALAQERYKHQVFSDFNQRLGLYQIRIGIFASHAEAEEFLHQIRQDYPLDYRESWIASVQQ